MARTPIIIGLDLETSGVDENRNGILQVAVVMPDGETFSSDVRPSEDCVIEQEALKVNGFTEARWLAAPSVVDVDAELEAWLAQRINTSREYFVPVGWNIAKFDMAFLRVHMPKSFKRFGYHSIDLFAVCYTMAQAFGVPYLTFKDRAWQEAAKALGGSAADRHDAIYDARGALASWRWVVKGLRGLKDKAAAATPVGVTETENVA